MPPFQTGLPERATLDPTKRVNYSFGLVLGVDEFAIEQNYFVEKGRLHNRALHGYGVVSGLRVSVRDESLNPEVVVGPGLAVDQHGREICVSADQCARLNTWIQRNREAVRAHMGGDEGTLELSVVLCYRECATDVVPIAGRPCASDEESRAPSRIAESFELSLRLARPETREEDAVRRFGELLGQIAISAEPGEALSAEELSQLVRGLAAGDYPLGEPNLRLRPEEACEVLGAALHTWVAEVRPALVGNCAGGSGGEGCLPIARLAFAVVDDQVAGPVQITLDERPVLLHARLLQEWLLCGRPAYAGPPHQFATVFARDPDTVRVWVHHPAPLSLPLEAVRVELDEVEVAVLGVTQLTAGVNVFDLTLEGAPDSFPSDSFPSDSFPDDSFPSDSFPDDSFPDDSFPSDSFPDDSFPDGSFPDDSFPSGPIGHKQRIAVSFDAALIDVLTSPALLLADTLGPGYDVVGRRGTTLSAYGVAELPAMADLSDVAAEGAAEGDVLIRRGGIWASGQALAEGTPAGGDLADFYPGPTVVGLRGRPLADTVPSAGDALTWDGSQWIPATAGTGGPGLTIPQIAAQLPTLPFVTITRGAVPEVPDTDEFVVFQLWFHLDSGPVANSNRVALNARGFAVQVFGEHDRSLPRTPRFLMEFRSEQAIRVRRNLFALRVARRSTGTDDDIDGGQLLRFIFRPDAMQLEDGRTSLLDWLRTRPMKWQGHDGGSSNAPFHTITAFYRQPQPASEAQGSGPRVVAAGRFDFGTVSSSDPRIRITPRGSVFGDLILTPVSDGISGTNTIRFGLTFRDYSSERTYIVKGTPVVLQNAGGSSHVSFVVIEQRSRVPDPQPRDEIVVEIIAGSESVISPRPVGHIPTGVMIEITELS
jgi:hypothetical protein